MVSTRFIGSGFAAVLLAVFALPAMAQSFRVQCPGSTTAHPGGTNPDGSGIKCQQISGGDGFATMGDGTQTYLFGFGPLSGLRDLAHGLPGTQNPATFNDSNETHLGDIFTGAPVDQTANSVPDAYSFNGAIGLVGDPSSQSVASVDLLMSEAAAVDPGTGYHVGDTVNLVGGGSSDPALAHVSAVDCTPQLTCAGPIVSVIVTYAGTGYNSTPIAVATGGIGAQLVATMKVQGGALTGHVDPRLIMDVGVMNANEPAPMMAIDEDDEFFLTLTNVGMIMRPDLFEQHTVHFHGYPNASSFYDGVPDASVAINIGGSFTYYYLAPDAGTYFWHCHISPPEHLQMGMVGQIYVRPRQNRVASGGSLYAAQAAYEVPLTGPPSTTADYEQVRKRCGGDILCSTPLPAGGTTVNTATRAAAGTYAYNDGDGSTHVDVEYPIQMMEFDPSFHFVGMTFNPESFTDMKDKYFLLNGRSYPDTVGGNASTAGANVPSAMTTMSTDGTMHASQPLPTVINIPAGGRALLRISNLDVTEYQTLASLGVPMRVVGINARLLRDQTGNDMTYLTNSITMAGGESMDVILDASSPAFTAGQKYYLYTPNLDHLSNDAENFGGMMTEVNICNSVDPSTKACQ